MPSTSASDSMTAARIARRSAWRSREGWVVLALAFGEGDGDGDEAMALTAPALSSAATPAIPTVLTATAAMGFIVFSPQTRLVRTRLRLRCKRLAVPRSVLC